MYVYIYIYIYIHTHIHTFMYMNTKIHTYRYVFEGLRDALPGEEILIEVQHEWGQYTDKYLTYMHTCI